MQQGRNPSQVYSQKGSSLAQKGEFIDTNESQDSVCSKYTWIQEHEPTLHLSNYTDLNMCTN